MPWFCLQRPYLEDNICESFKSEVVDSFKSFGTITTMNVSNYISEYQEKLLIWF